jgi:hypothetical protein
MQLLTIKERQAREEEFYFRQFLTLNNDFKSPEISIPVEPATPDRLIKIEGKRIGIDLTKYYIDSQKSGLGGSLIQKEENDFENLVREAQRRFELNHTQRLYIIFRKDHNFCFPAVGVRKIKEDIITKIVKMVETSYVYNQPLTYFWNSLLKFKLQNIFSLVTIDHYPQDWNGHWGMSGGGGIPTVEYINIEAILNRKEKKIHGYLKVCDESWLLIHTAFSGGMSSWLRIEDSKDQISKFTFNTKFSKVFFLETRSDFLIEFLTNR